MSEIPVEHIADSHKLVADGRVDLFELTPSGGEGVVMFKPDNDAEWRGKSYTGLPLALTGEKKSVDSGLTMPQLVIGNGAVDLSPFKAFVYDGFLDNAVVVRQIVLLDNLINNRNIRETYVYRVKRVAEYSRTKITLQLATLSDSLGFDMPYRQYLPPAFPAVQM